MRAVWPYYSGKLHKRSLIEVGAKITEYAFKDEGSAQSIVDKAEQEIFAISQEATKRDFIPIKDALASSFDRLMSSINARAVYAVCRPDLRIWIFVLPVCRILTSSFLPPGPVRGKPR
jgi:hypothetical protein